MQLITSDEWRYYGHDELFVISHGPVEATPATVATTARVVREYRAQHGSPLAYIVLVEPDGAGLNPNTNAALEAMQRDLSADIVRCQAVAVLGKGFLAGHFISFASRIFLSFRKRAFPTRAFGAIVDLATWVGDHATADGHSAEEIREVLQRVQADAARHWAGRMSARQRL